MRQYLKYLKGDSVVWIISVLMLTFSLVTVYSFVPILIKIEGGSPFNYLYKHFIYVLLAFYLCTGCIHEIRSMFLSWLSLYM